MEKERLEYFKARLLKERKACQEQIRHLEEESLNNTPREAAGDLSGYSQHLADMGSDNYERDKDLKLVAREAELLAKIEEALIRIEKGTYVLCERCGGEISEARLEAIPYTTLCLRCHEIEEKRRREGG